MTFNLVGIGCHGVLNKAVYLVVKGGLIKNVLTDGTEKFLVEEEYDRCSDQEQVK